MRTTLTIDDQIIAALKETARRSGKPFKQVANEALRAGLRELARPTPRPYRLQPADMGQARFGIDLDKALHLAAALEDDAIVRELEQHK
ncbi:antitoxin VapB33 [bacterium BMS3Bbin12]|nr:antitoxin VapB33 [bacterium BMS3Bbin12]GBE50938.1 antitoxin VapB33 [bacterium BMS3Bbin13]